MKRLKLLLPILLGVILAITPFLSTCGPEEEVTPTTPGGSQGDLVVLVPTLANEIWAPDVGSSTDLGLISPAFECLARIPEEGEPFEYLPELADSWTTSEDGLTWDFYLHEGVQWHDGWGEFTAEDVKFTYDLVGSEGSVRDVPLQVGPDQPIKSYEVIDTYHLRVNLNAPMPLLLFYLSDPQSLIVCKEYFETVGHDVAMKDPVGTGSWDFVDYQPANYIKFEAVENHWRKTPAFQTLTIKSVPELSARLAMLETGEADIAEIPPDKVAEVEAAGLHTKLVPNCYGFEITLGGSVLPSRETYDPTCPWVYNADESWDSDQNQKALMVRQALALAINNDAIVDVILQGFGEQTPIRSWPLGMGWDRPEWAPWPYDPEGAKDLLVQAGYPNGFDQPITMYAITGAGSPLSAIMAEAVAADWQTNLGLDVDIVPTEWAIVRAETSDRDTAWKAYVTGWPVFIEPWLMLTYTLYSRGAFVEGFENLEADTLLDLVSNASDFEQRKEAALNLGDYYIEHIVEIGLATASGVIACGSKVGEWHLRYMPPYMPFEYEQIEHAD
jgi:peptide/nickel transport system substrate-binding protein